MPFFFSDCVPPSIDVTSVFFPVENSANINFTKLKVTPVEHPEFLSVFRFPKTPAAVADCLLDDPVKWIGLQVSSSSTHKLRSASTQEHKHRIGLDFVHLVLSAPPDQKS